MHAIITAEEPLLLRVLILPDRPSQLSPTMVFRASAVTAREDMKHMENTVIISVNFI